MRRPVSIAPPKGKLGVLTPGMGAVSTTLMAGVELVRTRRIRSRRLADADGHDSPGQADRRSHPENQGFRARSQASTISFSADGTSSRTTPTKPPRKAGVLDSKDLAKVAEVPEDNPPHEGRLRPELRQELARNERQEGQNKIRSRRADSRRHSPIQEEKQARSHSSWSGAAAPKCS